MNRIICLDVRRVRGNKDKVTLEEIVTGCLDFVPRPDGGGWLMLPIAELVNLNEEARKRGTMEISPLSKFDIRKRSVVELTKKECVKLLTAQPGEIITVIRKGWGRTWHHKIQVERINHEKV